MQATHSLVPSAISLLSDIPSSGVIHVSFRVNVADVPRWLPCVARKPSSASHTGQHIEFQYDKHDRVTGLPCDFVGDLHSVGLVAVSFADRGLKSASWHRIKTQKGDRGVIDYWFGPSDEPMFDARLAALFFELCGETWDYLEVYDNPAVTEGDDPHDANLSLVLKGPSKKPVQHQVVVGEVLVNPMEELNSAISVALAHTPSAEVKQESEGTTDSALRAAVLDLAATLTLGDNERHEQASELAPVPKARLLSVPPATAMGHAFQVIGVTVDGIEKRNRRPFNELPLDVGLERFANNIDAACSDPSLD